MKVGIGLVPNENISTQIITLEKELSKFIESESGLKQPPHITIKSPFEVSDMSIIESFFDSFAGTVEPIQVSFSGFDYFEPTTAYIAIKTNKHLQELHNRLLRELEVHLGIKPNMYESSSVVFHTSIAVNMSQDQFDRANQYLSQLPLVSFETVFDKIGLFLLKEDTNNWIIYRSTTLSQ